jgi:hypothetical protein
MESITPGTRTAQTVITVPMITTINIIIDNIFVKQFPAHPNQMIETDEQHSLIGSFSLAILVYFPSIGGIIENISFSP